MESEKTFYCIVIDKITKREILDIGKVKALDWYYARHKAAAIFADKARYIPSLKKYSENENSNPWYVDSMEI